MNVELFKEMVSGSTEKVENLNRNRLNEVFPHKEGKSFHEVMKSLSEKLEITKENEKSEDFSEKISKAIKKLNEILSKNSSGVPKELKKAKNGIEGFSENESFSGQGDSKVNRLLSENNNVAVLDDMETRVNSKDAKIVKDVKKNPGSLMKDNNNKANTILIDEGKRSKKVSNFHFQGAEKNKIYVSGNYREIFKDENIRTYRKSKVYKLSDVKQDNLPEVPEKARRGMSELSEKFLENNIPRDHRRDSKDVSKLKSEKNLQGNFLIFKDNDKSKGAMEKPQEHDLKSSSDLYQFHKGVITQGIKFSNVKKNAKVLSKNLEGSFVENLDKNVDTGSVSDRNYIYTNLIVNDGGQVNRVGKDFQVPHSELGEIVNKIVELSKKLDIYVSYPRESMKSFNIDKDGNYNTKFHIQVRVAKQKRIVLERMEISVDKKTKKLFSTEIRAVHELKDKVGSNMDKIKNIQASKKFQDIYSGRSQMKEDVSKNNHHSEIKSDNDNLSNYDKSGARVFDHNEKPSTLIIGKKEFTVEDVANRVVETIVRRSSERNFRETAVLRLNPPDLGRVEVTIIKDGDNVEIRFKVFNKDAQDALEKSIHLLSSRLNSQGFNIEKIEVMQENRDSYNDEYKDENNPYEDDSRENNERRQKERKEEGENDDGE